ncbi:MAG: non-hydrolyzing UDP-N-acetylglucosamine 2-epimerase [Candidatus Scalinduaceae bacterium]
MFKILTIFGTRPEAIKMAPVINELERYPNEIELCVCVTGQHREMLDQVLSIFNIKPDIDLNIMKNNQSLTEISTRSLSRVTRIMDKIKPDLVLVQGDTTSAMSAALAAFYKKIPLGHIEAGLRTKDRYSPFPEEINRRMISALSTYHFAPTNTAVNALLNEGFCEDDINLTGNTVIDALLAVVRSQKSEVREKAFEEYFKKRWDLTLAQNTNNLKLILVTGHRRENFGDGFEHICFALKEIAVSNPDVMIIYPVHLNPNVQRPVREILNGVKNIHLIDPLDYETFVFLMSRSYLILTDSGGIQEEAPSLGKPVIVLRRVTERPEAVEAGTVRLVGTDKDRIVSETLSLLNDSALYSQMSTAHNPYGDGKASERIVEFIKNNCHNFNNRKIKRVEIESVQSCSALK